MYHGLTQIDVAILSGVSVWTIQAIESNKADTRRGRQWRTRVSTAKLIAGVFELEVGELFSPVDGTYLVPIVDA